jgi:hypothetical protein
VEVRIDRLVVRLRGGGVQDPHGFASAVGMELARRIAALPADGQAGRHQLRSLDAGVVRPAVGMEAGGLPARTADAVALQLAARLLPGLGPTMGVVRHGGRG